MTNDMIPTPAEISNFGGYVVGYSAFRFPKFEAAVPNHVLRGVIIALVSGSVGSMFRKNENVREFFMGAMAGGVFSGIVDAVIQK